MRLTDAQIDEMIHRREAGERAKAIARHFGVSRQTVSYVTRHVVVRQPHAMWPLVVTRVAQDGTWKVVGR